MKKFIIIAVLSIMPMTLIAGTQAIMQNDDKNAISEFCSTYHDMGLTHGGCVAYFVTHNIVPHDASICRDESIQSLLGVTNHGQCVKKLSDMRK